MTNFLWKICYFIIAVSLEFQFYATALRSSGSDIKSSCPTGLNVCQLKTSQRRREPGGHAEVSLLPRRRRLSLARPHKSRSAIRTGPEKEGNDRGLQIKRLYKGLYLCTMHNILTECLT